MIEVDAGGGLARVSTPCIERRASGHTLVGRVIARDPTTLTVEHEPIEGFMPAMTMDLALPVGEPVDAGPGDRVRAHLVKHADRFWLVDIQTVARGELALRDAVPALGVGDPWPAFDGRDSDNEPFAHSGPMVVSFLYTRCPNPEFCPDLVARLLALQDRLPAGARIVTVSLDPEHDTPDVLARYGTGVGANPSRWSLVHVDRATLATLALRAGQMVVRDGDAIRHAHRLLVIGADGALIERYDHNRWPIERVVRQLAEGVPVGLHPAPSR